MHPKASSWGEISDPVQRVGACLAALYLDGLRRSDCSDLARSRWVRVEDVLRRRLPSGQHPSAILRDVGLWEEALCLTDDALLARSGRLVASGAVVVGSDPFYPVGWRKATGPAALWSSGPAPFACGRSWIGIVGTRRPPPELVRAARRLGAAAVQFGFGVLSGGAIGIDQLALRAACDAGGPSLAIIPSGLARSGTLARIPAVSACPPTSRFEAARAMQRNAWIYAASRLCIVLGPRLAQGGTWHGAIRALRNRLTTVAVLDTGDSATSALLACGALGFRLSDADDALKVLESLLDRTVPLGLFGRVSEQAVAYAV